MRWIYISPHFDDAVLSCGGLIWEQTHSGMPVEIWTICAGDPPPGPSSSLADEMHGNWKTASALETVQLRRVEDQNAARRVGAQAVHFPIPDCIYRRSNTGSLFYTEDVFIAPNPREKELAEQIAALLTDRLRQYDTLVCPLTIGGHVDHRITRAALEMLDRPLWYYADVPYALRHPEQMPAAVDGLVGKRFYISSRGLKAWQEAIAAHASQISSLFEDADDMRRLIRDYKLQNDGLTLWEPEEIVVHPA